MHDIGCSGLVHWDDPEGWHGEGKASLVAQMIKNLPAIQETQVRSLGQEGPLDKGMAGYPLMCYCLDNPMGRGA